MATLMDELEAAKLEILEREVLVKERELDHRIEESKISAWRSPLVVAVLAAALGAFSNAGITFYNAKVSRDSARVEFDRASQLAAAEAENARILEMIKIGDPDQVQRNLQFLVEANLVTDADTVASIEAYYAGRAPGTGPGASSIVESGIPSRAKLFRAGEVLTYSFVDEPSETDRSLIESAMREWENYANIVFEYRDEPTDAIVRIGMDRSAGSWAYLGRDALNVPVGAPTINLASLEMRVILSELGHVLGLPNEHQNPTGGPMWDEHAVVDYFSQNSGWSLPQIQRSIFSRASHYPCSRSFDPNSIMMPDFPDQIFSGSVPTTALPELSETDKACAAEMYPFEPTVAEK